MTFTATQEGNEASTKAMLSGTNIHWESEDKISLLYSSENKEFTLNDGAGSTSGKFSGEAGQSTSYTAVYPYQSTASLSGNDVTNVTLPATQTATDNSFDKNAALMMAQSNSTTLNFKNAVSLVKVTPQFDCTKIELEAADGSGDILAGKGTLNWNDGNPKINITEETSKTITLTGSIVKNNSYYIVVPTGTLNRMWKITFTADDGKNTAYTRYCSKSLTVERNKIINLGNFATDSPFWADEHRGTKVTYEQEVDLGLTITGSDNKKYKVIFANANLTTTGLATNEYDYGDYFAWGATEPLYTTLDKTANPWTVTWNTGKEEGYTSANAPMLSKTYNENDVLSSSDDAANVILGGDWQIPTIEIWQALNTERYTWTWTPEGGYNGRQVKSNADATKTLFLPAAGYVEGTTFYENGSSGKYWSGTASANLNASDYLYFGSIKVDAQCYFPRHYGFSVRPVRLVEVPAATTEG